MDIEHDERLVFFDIESGGFFDVVAGQVKVTSPIIQIAAIAINRDYREIETFEVKVWFNEQYPDRAALATNHYDREIWRRDGLSPEVAAKRFADS